MADAAVSSPETLAGGAAARTPARPLRVRAMGFPFAGQVPRYWLFGNPYPTHTANALNLLFADGERFFMRSIKHYTSVFEKDPELLAQVRAFYGQEGRHGHEHERFNRVLEAQGYELDGFLRAYRKIAYGMLEPSLPPALRLSITAALEHLTASMGHSLLTGPLMDHAHPVMAALFRWHSAEEIEHKAIAFDVLERVDPRWGTRALGMLLAFVGLMAFWTAGTQVLLRQEAARGVDMRARLAAARRDPRLRGEHVRRRELLRRAIGQYLRPGFHPDQNDDYELARAYLASIGRLDG